MIAEQQVFRFAPFDVGDIVRIRPGGDCPWWWGCLGRVVETGRQTAVIKLPLEPADLEYRHDELELVSHDR